MSFGRAEGRVFSSRIPTKRIITDRNIKAEVEGKSLRSSREEIYEKSPIEKGMKTRTPGNSVG